MTEIPEDIIREAKEVASGWGLDEFATSVHAKEIASTIYSERKRCADVARVIGEAYRRHDPDPTRSAVADTIARGIIA